MKIGFFGNANNYPFMLARSLRRIGHEVLFIVNSLRQLDRPQNRYKDIPCPYPGWICDVSPFGGWFSAIPSLKRARVIKLLRSCDAVVLNEEGPSLLDLIHRPAVVLLTGTDLEYWANPRTISIAEKEIQRQPIFLRRLIKRAVYKRMILAQRAGLCSAVKVNYFARGLVPYGDALLDEIGLESSQRVFFMMTDTEDIQKVALPNNTPLRVFCATRLNWGRQRPEGANELNYKGSDIMIRGIGLFWRKTGIRLDICIVRKGLHVDETVRLSCEEGLADQITWLEEMTQLEVLEEFKKADIVFEQLGLSVVGMAGLDAMAIGRPIIANGRPEIMRKAIGVESPICQARSPLEVCAQLERLVPNLAERERVADASRKYVEEYFSAERAAHLCLNSLSGTSNHLL